MTVVIGIFAKVWQKYDAWGVLLSRARNTLSWLQAALFSSTAKAAAVAVGTAKKKNAKTGRKLSGTCILTTSNKEWSYDDGERKNEQRL